MGEGRASPGRIAFFALSISPIGTPAYAEPQPDTSCYNAALPRICSPLAQARDTKASTVYHGNVGLRRPSLALSEKGGLVRRGLRQTTPPPETDAWRKSGGVLALGRGIQGGKRSGGWACELGLHGSVLIPWGRVGAGHKASATCRTWMFQSIRPILEQVARGVVQGWRGLVPRGGQAASYRKPSAPVLSYSSSISRKNSRRNRRWPIDRSTPELWPLNGYDTSAPWCWVDSSAPYPDGCT